MRPTAPPQLKGPPTSVISDGRKKLQYVYTDGSEMVEEYDVITDELLVRKGRRPNALGGEGQWVYEVGQDQARRGFNPDTDLLRESNTAPQLTRKDSAEDIVIRIRNLPYPKEVFSLTIEPHEIVVRTSNKKYFKRIEFPDMKRAQVALKPEEVTWEVQFNTLIITYKKPVSIRVKEAQEKKERASLKAVRVQENGEPQCPQQ